jgi:hypothetical protein
MRDGLVIRNVAKLIERPSQPKKEMRAAPYPSGGWFI